MPRNAATSLQDALNAHVGHGDGRMPVIDLVRAIYGTDEPELEEGRRRHIYRLMNCESEAKWEEVHAFIDVLGPSFANALTRPLGIVGAFKAGSNVDSFQFWHNLDRYRTEVSERLIDRIFCHRDHAATRPLLNELVQDGAALITHPQIDRLRDDVQ